MPRNWPRSTLGGNQMRANPRKKFIKSPGEPSQRSSHRRTQGNDVQCIQSSATPDRSPLINPRPLNQRISEQVIVGRNLKTMKVSNLPNVLSRMFVSLFKSVQPELPAELTVGASGPCHQPTTRSPSHPLEERAGERRPSCREAAPARVCHRVCAPLPNCLRPGPTLSG